MEITVSPESISVSSHRPAKNDNEIMTNLVKALIRTIPGHDDPMIHFSKSVTVHGVRTNASIDFIQKIIKCYLLVQNSASTKDVRDRWSVQDFINFQLQPHETKWQDLRVYLRYENQRLGLIADPEYLIISWCIKFQNYDVNAGALIPSFPSDFTNQPLTPSEIKNVAEMWILKQMIIKKRSRSVVIQSFKKLAPVLYDLVYTAVGFEVLSLVYAMLMVIKTDRSQPIRMRIDLLNMYKPLLQKFRISGYFGVDRVGFFFKGFPHPMVRPELIMAVFILNNNIFKPYEDNASMREFLRKKNIYNWYAVNAAFRRLESSSVVHFERLDYDPKSGQTTSKPVRFQFFPKGARVIPSCITDFQHFFYSNYSILDILSDGSVSISKLFAPSEKQMIRLLSIPLIL